MIKRERESVMTYIFEDKAVFNSENIKYMDQVESLVFELMCDDYDFYDKVVLLEESEDYTLYKVQDNVYCICWFDGGESLAYHQCFSTLEEAHACLKEEAA